MNYVANQEVAWSAAPRSASGDEIRPWREPILFTKCQAAEVLNVSESSINWLLRKGSLPRRKIAGKIRFTRSDLQALIEASAVTQCCAAEQKGA